MLTRGDVEALSKQLKEPGPAFDAALAQKDFDQATAVAVAALLAGQPLDVPRLARIAADVSVPDVLLPLFARAQGSTEALWPTLALDEYRAALVLTAEVARLEGAPPAWLRTALAQQIERSLGDASYELLVACAHQVDAPELFEVRHSVGTYLTAADAREVWATIKRDVGKPLTLLPEQELSLPTVSVKHGSDEPGRNDPCPCGSGQKYKKCHGATGGLTPSVSRPRLERLAELLPKLEAKHVRALTATDLAQTDWSKASDAIALAVFREQMYRQRWVEAEAVLEQLITRPELKDRADGFRDEYIWQALQNGRPDDAARQRAKVAKPETLTPVIEIHQGLLGPWPAWFTAMEDVARPSTEAQDLLDQVDLAYVLLQRAPGLGLQVAASLYPRLKPEEARTLYGSMDDARDRLGLPAVSARQRVRKADAPVEKKAPDAKEKAKIRELETTLEESKRKMRQIEQQLEKEKAKASTEPAVPAPQPGARKAFAQRIDELEDRIREGNAERAKLRKDVADLTERLEAAGKSVPAPKKDEAAPDDAGEGATRPRGLMLAQWEPRAVESLEELPARVQEDVLVKIAELGSGDAAHWIEVKALQGVAGLYSARIGIHYRALFTVEAKTLRVHEVVHREGFDTALRRFK